MPSDIVFIVTVGELYEGGHVQSVHTTLEGAKGAVSAFLADEEERSGLFRRRNRREGRPDFDPDFRWRQTDENRWANCVDFIRIDAHQVLP